MTTTEPKAPRPKNVAGPKNVSGLKHEEIARALAAEIREGHIAYGRQLPGETTLAERFSVSRNTVRAALTDLGRAGLISTRSGKGSFVTYDGRPINVRLGWARALQQQGVATKVDVLRAEEIDDPSLAAELDLPSSKFFAIDRLRSIVDGPVISFERSRVRVTPETTAAIAEGKAAGSLTRMLLEANLVASIGQQWVEVRMLDRGDARLLERAEGDAFLWSRCITRNAIGEFVEHVESLLDPAHFRLHFQFSSQE